MKRAAVLLALMAAGCASGSPAPIVYGGSGDRLGPPASPPAETARASNQTMPARTPAVQEQQPDWADGEGTPLSAYALQPGDAQPFDPARLPPTHRVGAGESLYDIASRYQAPLRALIDQNNLEPPYTLAPGRELRLPPPRFHRVASGESFEVMARRYNVDLRSLALLNRMQPPYRVRQGDRIVLLAMARESGAPAPSPALDASNSARVPAGAPGLHARFAMPIEGDIVARFGVQPGGGRIDGLEIAGREGAAIHAAADGDVVYAGSDLEAYGTLVLVRHADNYVTAYGYARRALVREGQRVRAGQEIAELGPHADGRARLLFQVRQGSAALDPAPLLGR
jgi:murein DD-endopeptidase MepM/ murein hydrolase activator NlpD